MNYIQARTLVKEMKLAHGSTLCFKAGVIVLLGISNKMWQVENIKSATGYKKKDIIRIINNLRESEILIGETIYMESPEDEESNWAEFVLIAMVGGGKIVRNSVTRENLISPNYMLPTLRLYLPIL